MDLNMSIKFTIGILLIILSTSMLLFLYYKEIKKGWFFSFTPIYGQCYCFFKNILRIIVLKTVIALLFLSCPFSFFIFLFIHMGLLGDEFADLQNPQILLTLGEDVGRDPPDQNRIPPEIEDAPLENPQAPPANPENLPKEIGNGGNIINPLENQEAGEAPRRREPQLKENRYLPEVGPRGGYRLTSPGTWSVMFYWRTLRDVYGLNHLGILQLLEVRRN